MNYFISGNKVRVKRTLSITLDGLYTSSEPCRGLTDPKGDPYQPLSWPRGIISSWSNISAQLTLSFI